MDTSENSENRGQNRNRLSNCPSVWHQMESTRFARLRWWPMYRAAIAAWLGHREQAVDLLSQSRAEGWGSFNFFHDVHRVLFEPLEGMPDYEALLHPDA